MMANWTKILPFFFVAWYAKRNCEIYTFYGHPHVMPYKGVKIEK